MAGSYKRGSQFPAEHFVQMAIEAYFLVNRKFEREIHRNVDLICVDPSSGERWHIEAKGISKYCGLDFRTGLGQLVQGMDNPSTRYAIAVPDINEYRTQIAKVSQRIVDRLGIHWLLVAEDGSVKVVSPNYHASEGEIRAQGPPSTGRRAP